MILSVCTKRPNPAKGIDKIGLHLSKRARKRRLPCNQHVIKTNLCPIWQNGSGKSAKSPFCPVTCNGIAHFAAGGKSDPRDFPQPSRISTWRIRTWNGLQNKTCRRCFPPSRSRPEKFRPPLQSAQLGPHATIKPRVSRGHGRADAPEPDDRQQSPYERGNHDAACAQSCLVDKCVSPQTLRPIKTRGLKNTARSA